MNISSVGQPQTTRPPAPPVASGWVNLDNLDTLTFSFPGQDGTPKTGWAIYAEPVDASNPLGPVRQVGDADEGFSCVDDVARVALVYLDRFEKTGDPELAERATAAVSFCLNQHDGQGRFYNFVEHDGRINQDGPTSKPGLNWWGARAFWALARAERVLAPTADPALLEKIHGALDKSLEQLEKERGLASVPPELLAAYQETGVTPGGLVDHSGSITSIYALGLIERLRAKDPNLRAREQSLLVSYGDAMQRLARPSGEPLLGGLHLNSLADTHTVHLYGNRQVQALADGGRLLGRADWIASARQEADQAYPRILTSYLVPFAFSPAPEPNPQIAYAAEATVSNLQAVYRATGESKFSLLAGLYGSWFSGANVAGLPVYHRPSGRSFDGVDPQGVSINSGAESNVETQLAMAALDGSPGEALVGLSRSHLYAGDKLLSEGQLAVAAGQPHLQPRTLNGGAIRQDWLLEPADRLRLGTGGGLLTWKSRDGAPLLLDPDGPGPLPAEPVAARGDGWQVTALPSQGLLEVGGAVVVDSLVQRPEQSRRQWSDGRNTWELCVAADNSWNLQAIQGS